MLYKLESLRGVFALIVIIAHSPYNIYKKELHFMSHADILVDFFFILSGFIISLAYEHRISKGLSFKSYFISRLGRIYPLHFFTLILCLLVLVIKQFSGLKFHFLSSSSVASFFSNFFLIHSLGIHNELTWNFPSWSISVEFYTYLLFFLGLKIYDKKKNIKIPIIISFACYMTLLIWSKKSIGSYSYDLGILRCIGGFYFGVCIYRFQNKFNLKIFKHIYLLETLSIFFLIFLFTITKYTSFRLDLFFILVFGIIILVYAKKENGFLGKIFNSKILKTIGRYSYSIYLMHSFVITIVIIFTKYILRRNSADFSGYQSVIINFSIIIITLIISKYTFKYIEDYYRIKAKRYILRKK